MQHPRNRPQPMPNLALREVMRKREFGRFLQSLGTSKSAADRVSGILPHHTMQALLPLWRRLRVTWKSRHE